MFMIATLLVILASLPSYDIILVEIISLLTRSLKVELVCV